MQNFSIIQLLIFLKTLTQNINFDSLTRVQYRELIDLAGFKYACKLKTDLAKFLFDKLRIYYTTKELQNWTYKELKFKITRVNYIKESIKNDDISQMREIINMISKVDKTYEKYQQPKYKIRKGKN